MMMKCSVQGSTVLTLLKCVFNDCCRCRSKINLIVFNPHQGTNFLPSTSDRVSAFRSLLVQGGLVATVRDSRGDDQMAACGQLGSQDVAARPPPMLTPPERLRGAVTVDLTS